MNKVILIGNLGADPECRTAGSGTVVANLRLATNGREKVNGQWQDAVEWHRVVAFGKTAELAQQYLSKGSKVAIEGQLRTRKWTNKDGQDVWTTEVVCDRLEFVDRATQGSRHEGGGSGYDRGSKGSRQGGGASDYDGGGYNSPASDDIPF